MTAEALPLRRFGQTDLHVTPVCLGCAPLASLPEVFYPVPEEQAYDVIHTTLDSPIRFLDTAAGYGDGESERRIGVVLRERGALPPGYVLATKVDRDFSTGDFSGDQTRRCIERSMQLLGLDHLQIVYIHDPEFATTTFEEIMARGGAFDVLNQYKQAGAIGAIGVAGGPIALMMRYIETGAFDAVITHNRYTLINRAAAPLLDLAAQQKVAVVNAAPYGGGMLAKGPDTWGKYAYRDAPPQLVERVRRMAVICDEYGVPLAAAALQFSLREPRITSTIVGMTRSERVAQTLDLARYPIPDEIWPRLDAVGFDSEDM